MIGHIHIAVEVEPANLRYARLKQASLAEVLLGAGADDAPDDQHADQQFEADRRRPIEL
jgi:hypothetical protein